VDLKRIKKDVDGAVTKFVYESAPQLNEVYPFTYVGENQFEFGVNILAEYKGSNNLQATYVNALDVDENIAKTIGQNIYYFLQDGLGSVRNLVDASEVVQNTYDYYAFGKDLGTPTENVVNQFNFTAREWDEESTLYFYRTRHYAPALGRFIQKDVYFIDLLMAQNELQATAEQIRKLLPLYTYVNDNPINQLDPFGKKTDAECLEDLKDCKFRAGLRFAACGAEAGIPNFACIAGCAGGSLIFAELPLVPCILICEAIVTPWTLYKLYKCFKQHDKDKEKCNEDYENCLKCSEDRELF